MGHFSTSLFACTMLICGYYAQPNPPPQWLNYHTMRMPIVTRSGSPAENQTRCSIGHLIGLNKTFHMKVNHSLQEKQNLRGAISLGGHLVPKDCIPLQRVAIVVPFRDRPEHLKVFAPSLHRFLIHQNVAEYRLYVVEQVDQKKFNRAKLFNIGYHMIRKNWLDVDCFIFHDVELIPLNLGNLYMCASQPRHMTSNILGRTYEQICFGGATAFTTEQFQRINGFSNMFFGWGGEDDELRMRVVRANYTVAKLPADLATYTKLPHSQISNENVAENRYQVIYDSAYKSPRDGINSLQFELSSFEEKPFYTSIQVNL